MGQLNTLITQAQHEHAAWLAHCPTDTRAQLALLHIAVHERSDDAWHALYTLYHTQLVVWSLPCAHLYEDGVDALANRAFARFWHALTPERRASFASLAALLGYMRLCVRTEAIDDVRTHEAVHARLRIDLPVRTPIDARIEQHAFWVTVREHVNADEWRLLVRRFVIGEKPQQIQQSEQYSSITAVYKVINRLRHRLSRPLVAAALRGEG